MGVTFQCLVFGLGILIRHALRAANRYQRAQQSVVRGAGAVEKLARRVAALLGEREQQMLGGNELILEMAGFVEGALEHLIERLRKVDTGLPAGSLGKTAQQVARLGHNGSRLHAAFFQQRLDDAFLFIGQRDQQVQWKHHLAFARFGERLRLLQSLLCFLRQFV